MAIEESRVSLPPETSSPALGRRALDRLADHVPKSTLDDARLLLSELVTNAVRHAGLDPDQPISVVVRTSDTELSVEVSSAGRGFERGAVDFGSEAGTGWGLFLLEGLSDAWGAERDADGNSVVWFRLRLDRA